MYLKVVVAEGLKFTCHYCERVLKQGCRNEESFQAEVTELKSHWLETLVMAGAIGRRRCDTTFLCHLQLYNRASVVLLRTTPSSHMIA